MREAGEGLVWISPTLLTQKEEEKSSLGSQRETKTVSCGLQGNVVLVGLLLPYPFEDCKEEI